MISRKSFLILIVILFFISNVSLAVICARLQSVSAGEDHTLALMEDNTLWACGSNSAKQLGLGSSVQHVYSLKKVKGENGVGFLKNVVTYDAGWLHSLAADSNGTLWSWGTDDLGQLGNGPGSDPCYFPTKVHGLNNIGYLSDTVDIVYVSAGRSGKHSLAVDSDGYVYAWGNNGNGQCGDGSSGNQKDTPVLVLDDNPQTTGVYLGDIAHIIQADAGVDHSIALDNNGHVWHWGSGSSTRTYPEKVKASGAFGGQQLSNIVQISSCYHSVAVDSNHNVWEWSSSSGAYKVPGGEMGTTYLENIVEVSAGYSGYNSMARTSDGHVLVWNKGSSAYPEYVEDGEMRTQSGLLEGIISINAGYYDHKVAVCENGYGWAWGNNNGSGQFGVGDTNPRPEPAQMLCAEASSSIYLRKTSEIQGSEPNCARPFIGVGEDNYLVYEICYGNPITNPSDPNYYGNVYDVNIVEHLPIEVNYYSATGGGEYDSNTHTVTWTIGELAPGDSNCFTLTTKVNNYARPGGEISNFVEMTADKYYSYRTDTVPVCNWGTEIIYVDKDANGYNNGTKWVDAYTDLRDAFTGAQNLGADITAIWVAAGTYKPIYDMGDDYTYQNATFELLEDVGLFGHFGGIGTYETSTSQRNFADANKETILEGQIGTQYQAVYYVVKAKDVTDGLIDGFTVRGSYNGAGIKLENSNVGIANCKLKNKNSYGIQAVNYSYTDIHNCLFVGNSSQNINATLHCWPIVSYCTFDGNDNTSEGIEISSFTVLDVENSIFKDHTGDGIKGADGALTVTDSTFDNANYGLNISDVTTTVTNCSIKNSNYNGIQASDSDLTIGHIVIAHSTDSGIHTTNGCSLVLKNSIVRYSGEHGINLNDNTGTTILNNWIHNNGINHNASEGSGFYSSNHTVGTLHLRNNTIYDNYTYGIECSEYGADPNIRNCIIAGNDSNDLYRVNGSFNKVNYCLLQNDHTGASNRTGDPGFMNIDIDADDLHLDETSQCKDAGDPNGIYGDETDIDGEGRIKYGRVDIGADEYYWSLSDFDEDGFVNFVDYAIFAAAWQSESGEGNYNEDYDIEDNNTIDMNDLALFCEDWLWQAAWPEKEILLAADFENGIPAGWTVVDGYNDGKTWMTDNPKGRSSSYWTGDFCIVDSDWARTVDMNESLITPAIDCSGAIEVTLNFSHYFQRYSSEKCDVDISINNGPWQTVLQYTGASTGGNITEDISALAADQPNVRIRWHYYEANDEYYWGIDNVEIIGNFRIPPMQMGMGDGGGSSLKSSMMMESSFFSFDTPSIIPSTEKSSDNLMLSAAESLKTRPERLTAKSQKFYDITPETTISAKQKTLENRKVNIKEIYKWLEELWLEPEVRKVITEDEWLKFIESVKNSE